jgi:CTP synthase (UTP-ammonia lyase)
VVSKLVCSLVGQTETIHLLPGSLSARAYGALQAAESFACNYGLNPAYQEQLFPQDPQPGQLVAAGLGPAGEVRLLELPGHPFFVASLFLPQARSTPQQPHPLILAFLKAAAAARML